MTHLSRWVAIATLAGLFAALWIVGRVGLAQVAGTVAAIGIGGFGLFLLSHGVVLWMLGDRLGVVGARPAVARAPVRLGPHRA